MEDGYSNLMIALAAGIATGLVFLCAGCYAKKTLRRLMRYCETKGYQLRENRERLYRALMIQGDAWRLSTGIRTSDTEPQSGSSGTAAYTEWITLPQTEESLPLLWVGTVLGTPQPLGDNLLPLLALLGQTNLQGMSVVPLGAALCNRFAMLRADEPMLSRAGEDLLPLLAAWPTAWPLRARVSRGSVAIAVPGKRLLTPQALDQLIQFGLGLQRYRCETIADKDESGRERTV